MVRYVLLLFLALGAVVPFTDFGLAVSRAIGGSSHASHLPSVGSRSEAAGLGSAISLARHGERVARFRRAASTLSNLPFEDALNAGELEAAVRTAQRTEDITQRSQLLTQVARKAGLDSPIWNDAESAARSIPDLDAQLAAYRQVVAARNELQVLREELDVVLDADDALRVAEHLRRIAIAEGPSSPVWAQATEQAAKIANPEQRVQAYVNLGRDQGDATRYLAEAIEAIEQVQDPATRASLLSLEVQRITDVDSKAYKTAFASALELWKNHQQPQPLRNLITTLTPTDEAVDSILALGKSLDEEHVSRVLDALRAKLEESLSERTLPDPAVLERRQQQLVALNQQVEPTTSGARLLHAARTANDIDSPFWSAAYETGLRIDEPTARQNFLTSLAQEEYSALASVVEESVVALRNASDEEIAKLDPAVVGLAVPPSRWPSTDATLASQLWRGASQVAQFFLDEDSSHRLWKQAAESLRSIENGSAAPARELDDLTDALFGLDAHGNTPGALFTAIDSWGRSPGSEQLLKRLVREKNSRAQGRALELALDKKTSPEDAQQWLVFLAEQGVIDAQLPQALTTPGKAHLVRRLYNDLGVQPDTQSLNHVLDVARAQNIDVETATPAQLDQALDALLGQLEGLKGLSSKQLVERLAADSSLAQTYFMMRASQTFFPQTPNANPSEFLQTVSSLAQVEQQVDLRLFKPSAIPNSEWHEALRARRRPSEDLVWEGTVGIPSIDETPALINATLGDDLAWLLDGGSRADSFEPRQGAQRSDKLATLLEDLADPANQHTLADFEALKKRILQRMRQMRNASDDDVTKAQWADIIDAIDQAPSPVHAAAHIPALLLKDPSLSLAPSQAMQGWLAQLEKIRAALDQRGVVREGKNMTIRYLDGVDDFVERTRFADSVACCFVGMGQIQHKARVSRDPHWFMLQIESTPKDAAQREAVGFVFGSYGFFDDEPALILNGVYSKDQDAATVAHVFDEIERRIAKPAGAKYVVTTNRHVPNGVNGGYGTHQLSGDWQPAAGHFVERPRAIRETNGQPASSAYDDTGLTVNQRQQIPANSAHLLYRAVRSLDR